MDLNRVQMFAQVVEQGSFTAAAKALGLTKATVSRKIAELEADAGVQLLFRTTRKLKLTEAGSAYYSKVHRILTDLRNAEDQLSANQEVIKGNLTLVCPIELGQLFLGRIFARFLAQYPDITIEAELSNRKVDVVEEGIDILFQITNSTDTRLQSYDLINTAKTLMASPAYLEKFGTPTTPKDLQQHKGIRLKSAHIDASWTLFDGQNWVTYEPEARLTVNNVTLAREAAIEGLGIATVPDLIARQALEDKQLIPLLEDFPMSQTKVTICFPQRAYLPRKYKVFIEFIYQSLSENTDYILLDIPDFVTLPSNNQS
ncbi:LysR family transcriptional regulator [Shewanella eurypsychrophilus]|uniref:LysR family transcriptional regulator n=1 Tax=Shewanella eurypsychrophilus TaxID=2593656 RepID=A0ABX6V145_9GAMM|nr:MULTISPECIES: LysR family transcriptional regulator [Shewanella]QPG56342.2 LysR family transcriptional regulator [Shewanella eurypsychrophilus]